MTKKEFKAYLEKHMKAVSLDDVAIILIKDWRLWEALAGLKIETPKTVGVLQVKDFDDIATLSPKLLEQYGWVRAS